MQQSVSDSESAPNTLQSATKRFLVAYRCIAKRYKALCNARLMQLVPGSNPTGGRVNSVYVCLVYHCTESFIIALPLSWYDLNNVERDIKHQAILIKCTEMSQHVFMEKNHILSGSDNCHKISYTSFLIKWQKATHIFSAKNFSIFVYHSIKILTNR